MLSLVSREREGGGGQADVTHRDRQGPGRGLSPDQDMDHQCGSVSGQRGQNTHYFGHPCFFRQYSAQCRLGWRLVWPDKAGTLARPHM